MHFTGGESVCLINLFLIFNNMPINYDVRINQLYKNTRALTNVDNGFEYALCPKYLTQWNNSDITVLIDHVSGKSSSSFLQEATLSERKDFSSPVGIYSYWTGCPTFFPVQRVISLRQTVAMHSLRHECQYYFYTTHK